MKLKKAFLFMSFVALICQMAYGMKNLNTPDERMERWMQLQREIADLNEQLRDAQQAYDALPGKQVEPDDIREALINIRNSIEEKSEEAKSIALKAQGLNDPWVAQKPESSKEGHRELGAGVFEQPWERRFLDQEQEKGHSKQNQSHREWGGAGDPPMPAPMPAPMLAPMPAPMPAPSTPFLTPKRKKYAIGAAIVIALGTLYKKAPQWMKNRVKRILAEHGKTLADVTPAEQDLLISASYARFNPAGSFFFQEAVLDMPEGQTFREELWPVLYHVYYGKKKVGRKRRTELRKLYDEAQEMVGEL